jgi:HEAT repeat protein
MGAGYLIVGSKPIQNEFWRIAAFFDPQLGNKLSKEYQNKSNEYLLLKLQSKSDIHASVAAEILISRKDRSLLPEYFKLLRSKDQAVVGSVIEAIGKIGDKQAIPYLENIVNMGPSSIQHVNALMALSEMQYEPIIPVIIKLAKQSKTVINKQSAIEMMGKYNRPEFLTILEEMAQNDESEYVRDDAKKVKNKLE